MSTSPRSRRPHELVTEAIALHLSAEEVGVRACVFGDRAHVGPVPIRDVAEERLALRKEAREEVLAEIEDLATAKRSSTRGSMT